MLLYLYIFLLSDYMTLDCRWIPDGQLCPTIPNRANYIHWINDLLTMHPSPWHDATVGTWGIDIGTGANCVYPLLGAAIHGWKFVGTGNGFYLRTPVDLVT